MTNQNRRLVIKSMFCGLALPTFGAAAQDRIPIGDAHSHIGLMERPLAGVNLKEVMQASGTSLIAWKVVADMNYIRLGARGIEQSRTPAEGESMRYFEQAIARMRDYLSAQGIPHVTKPEDVDAALTGQPYVVLSSEGANFLEDDPKALDAAYALGLRHLQLIHYTHNAIGDAQTMQPTHSGLDAFGRDVVAKCNGKGILIDLAHGTNDLIDQAFDISAVPLIFSHGWISDTDGSWQDHYGYQARRLSEKMAKKIASKGGVVGLWSLGVNVGGYPLYRNNINSYAKEIVRMVEVLGEDHVCFGTDMNGLQGNTVFGSYDDLRRIVDGLQERGLSEAAVRKVAIGNYARVLRAALAYKKA